MTGNVKSLNKPNESFGLVNTEECVKNKNKSEFKFFVWYALLAIIIIMCFVLSVLSLRLSYLASVSVLELRDEVTRLKTQLDNSWISQISEFEQPVYDDYVNASDPNFSNSLGEDGVGSKANLPGAIGIVKFTETDGTTAADPESVLAKVLLKEHLKQRVTRSVEPALEMKLITNATNEIKIQHTTFPLQSSEPIITAVPDDKHERSVKYFTKRSSLDKQFKVPVVASKLMKLPLHVRDSVEEFSVGPEPITPKMDIPLKRNKNRSRHNLETLDERGSPGKKKVLPAVHYDGDSSGYIVGKHTNYNGNGHLSHPSQIYSDWVETEWVKTMGMDEHFQMEKGLVKIKDHGLYLLYVQIYYLDDHDTNGYRVYKNEEALLQCTTMTHSTERIFKGNTCYTSRVEYLKENDIISIRDLANLRYTIFESGKSFFGLVKLK